MVTNEILFLFLLYIYTNGLGVPLIRIHEVKRMLVLAH